MKSFKEYISEQSQIEERTVDKNSLLGFSKSAYQLVLWLDKDVDILEASDRSVTVDMRAKSVPGDVFARFGKGLSELKAKVTIQPNGKWVIEK